MTKGARHIRSAPLFLAILGVGTIFLFVAPSPAWSACSFSFNWYCSGSGCARVMGRSTGTVGTFATEEQCESARSQFRGNVGRAGGGITTGSCNRSGICDEPSARRGVPQGGGVGTYAAPETLDTPPDYEAERRRMEAEEDMRRQAEEAVRQTREQAERLAAQRKFNQDKIDVLKGMKGVDFDGSRGLSTDSGDLGLKSSMPTLGVKTTPGGGDLALKPTSPDIERGSRFSKGSKDSAPVPTDLGLKSASPAPATKRPATTADVHYLGAQTANLVMDAIEAGGHDLDVAAKRLDDAIWRQPNDQNVRDAYAYVMGMSIGEGLVRAGKAPSGTPEFDPNLLAAHRPSTPALDRIERERPAAVDGAQFRDFLDWDTRFRKISVDVLSDNGGDFVKARDDLERRLKADPSDKALQSAFRAMQGAAVYQDDIERAKRATAGMKK